MENQKPTPVLSKEDKVKAIAFLIAVSLVAIFYFWACGGESKPSQISKEDQLTDKKIEAFVNCQEQVINGLKSPSTADFPSYSDQYVFEKGNDVFIVSSYVDSQNGFGAMIRTQFTCKVTLLPGDKYICEELAFY